MTFVFLMLIIYTIIGAAAGVLGGLLGISGGIVTVPCLLVIFHFLGFPQAYQMHIAIGTSLAAMVFNSLASAWSHNKHHNVLWDVARAMIPGIIFGSFAGAFVAQMLSTALLEVIFGCFACLLGIHFLFPYKPHEGEHKLPKKIGLAGLGFLVSSVANILGIGGGIITVPTLMAFKVYEKKAIGTSAATGLFISFIGAIAYLFFGIEEFTYPYTIGYLYLPAFIVLSITTFFFAPIGVKLTHRFSPVLLRKIFAVALFATGISMII